MHQSKCFHQVDGKQPLMVEMLQSNVIDICLTCNDNVQLTHLTRRNLNIILIIYYQMTVTTLSCDCSVSKLGNLSKLWACEILAACKLQ